MKPFPFRISFLTALKKTSSFGKGNRAFVIPVNGARDAIKSSAALLSSAISSALKVCVHRSGLSQ